MASSPSSPKKKVVSVARLLRRSTLQDHVTHDQLKLSQPDVQTVELIKLRRSFEDFESKPQEAKATVPNPAGHDILVSLPSATLVEIAPTASGWYAIFLIDETAKTAIESFVNTARRHYKETNMFGGLVSPFTEPTVSEAAHSRLHVKISEYGGKLLNTTFFEADGGTKYKPGDEILTIYSKPPLGLCTPTIHLAGYWFDSTKQGPLLFLSTTTSLLHDIDPSEGAAPTISELLKSPGGSVTRRLFRYSAAAAEVADTGTSKWRRRASSTSSTPDRTGQLKAEDGFLNLS